MVQPTMSRISRSRLVVMACALAAGGSMSLIAQSGPPSAQAPAAPQGAAPPAAPGGAAGRGAGRGNVGADFTPKPPVLPKTPAAEAETFLLPAGYRLELVASEPEIINPVAVEFDGNGRMFVAEMRTYMPDGDGTGQHVPMSRISMFESTKGDGKFDKHTVFVDKLLLPRMILPLDKYSILTHETDSDDVVKYTDTNNDGVADKREVFFTGVGRGRDGNLEHQQSGFMWGMDNWIYSTYNAFRFRWTPAGMLREPTGANSGQWGLAQDDDGKPWFIDAGGERGPMNFQVPIVYGSFSVTDQIEPGYDVVWPAPGLADMQGGMGRVRTPVNSLNHFTATAGPDVFRGHRLPPDLVGDLLFAEPVGRLIRRTKIVKEAGLTQLRNAYPGSEFIISTDPLFRPVNMRTGPDGTLYIADMYHGIIQEATWTPKGSYLRRKIEQYQMDKVTTHGRIWRLVFDGLPDVAATAASPAQPGTPGIAPDRTRPRMFEETAAQLVSHLSHANGWWRDTAQRLLVLRQDKSVVPALQMIVRSSDNLVARFHAMWTLEGLGALDASLVRQQMEDGNPRMRVQAIRASETLYKAGDRSLDADYRARLKDTDADVAVQAMMTLNVLKVPNALAAIRGVLETNQSRGVQELGKTLVTRATANPAGRGGAFNAEQQQQLQRGSTIYSELCFSCHGTDGRGTVLEGAAPGTVRAPSLDGSPRVTGHRDYVIKALLHGLTGPLDGQTFTEVMIPMGAQKDDWIADIASYVRNSFGNQAPLVTAADVARVRAGSATRKTSWTFAELTGTVPALIEPQATWIVTASHNAATAGRILPTSLVQGTWTTGEPQAPGMWLQIELPEPVALSEVQLDTAAFMAGGRGGFGGGGGRGAAPAPGTPVPAPVYGFPRGYKVEVSLDGRAWTAAAQGDGSAPTTTIALTAARAKFVRVSQTATVPDAPPWIVQRVRLYRAAAPPR